MMRWNSWVRGYRYRCGVTDCINQVPMMRWKSDAVVAWLELVVDMPMYSKACAANVKSGKVTGVLLSSKTVPTYLHKS